MVYYIDPLDLSIALAACVFVGYLARDIWDDINK